MSNPDDDPTHDPEAARFFRKVRRLMVFSLSATVIAIGVVITIIGFRISGGGAGPVEVTTSLPRGARVISTAVADDRIAVTLEMGGVVEIRTFDVRTLKPVGRLRFANEP